MKKILLSVCVAVLLASGANASVTVDWTYGGNLFDNSCQVGWFVQLYRDVDANTTLSTATFDNSGTPSGGASGDSLLGSFTTALESSMGELIYYQLSKDMTSMAGYKVYTVIFNAASIGDAGQSVVIDAGTWTVPAPDWTGGYQLTSVANSWQAVPEPGTFALFGLGLLTIAARKRFRK